ncbi:MAG: hypothetical protein QXI09_03520 [Candidatus Aenigmatarchaeota archaeon]
MKENLKLKNIVVIRIIDKNRVIREYRGENDVLEVGATCILNFIRGASANGNWNTINLFTSDNVYIKSLTGGFSDIGSGSGYKYIVLNVVDNSNDEYTFRKLGLYYTMSDNIYVQNLINVQTTDIVKGSTQTLEISWEIRISYTTV